MADIPEPVWRSPQGEVVSCVEKLKVLRENLDEIRQLCQDALEDAVLMGCDDAQFRAVLAELVIGHYDQILQFYGAGLGLRVARKHLGWYLDEAGTTHTRDAILTATDPAQVRRLLHDAFLAQKVAA